MKRAASILIVALVASLSAAACGKSTPATPSPSVSTLAFSAAAPDMVRIKSAEKLTVTATYTSGASEAVTATWTSDNASVATVDSAGTVTGVASGQAVITASYQGKSAARPIRVVPDYAGTWKGTWLVKSCQVQGNFQQAWCAGVLGVSQPVTITMQQARDQVSGTWVLQESNGTVQGSIAGNGELTLTGSTLQSGVTVTISSWKSVSTDNRTMSGTLSLTWKVDDRGSAQTDVELQGFTKQ